MVCTFPFLNRAFMMPLGTVRCIPGDPGVLWGRSAQPSELPESTIFRSPPMRRSASQAYSGCRVLVRTRSLRRRSCSFKDKNAVIYGGGGSIGGAVARAFAREGANVFLAGRTRAKLEEVSDEIRSSGGVAETAQVDALDGRAVDGHADAVAASAGGIDISFNLISHGDVHGTPMAEMDLEDYARPVVSAVRTTFLTWRAAARHMIRQRSGVILAFGGSGDPIRDYYIG